MENVGMSNPSSEKRTENIDSVCFWGFDIESKHI